MEGSELNPFIISLDLMEQNFLSGINVTRNHVDGTVPIWSRTNYDDYYNFEIRASKIFEDEVSPTYKCHICNISIPIAYSEEHNNSIKHKTCLKITNIALQRVQLFMTQVVDFKTHETSYNTYFCASCATEVPLKDKERHETMKQHTNSVKHDKMLKDCLICYINDESSDEYIKTVNNYRNNDGAQVKTDVKTDLEYHTIEITAINGSIINVPFNNFHGYFKVGNHIQCRVCKKLIGDNHKMEHMLSEEHRNKVMVPNKDVHCIREIDEIWSHCMLCNDIIMDVELHKQSSLHHDKLREAVILNTEQSQTLIQIDESGTTYCDLCNLNLPNVRVRSHLRSKKHKNKIILQGATQLENGGDENLLQFMKLNKKMEITCAICLEIVDNIDIHVNSYNHISKYNNLLKTNKVSELGDRFHCELCSIFVMKNYELSHVNGKKHRKQFKKKKSLLKSIGSESLLNNDFPQLFPKSNNITISPASATLAPTSHSNKHLESNKSSNWTLASTSQANNDVLQSSTESLDSNSTSESNETLQETPKLNGNFKTISLPNIDSNLSAHNKHIKHISNTSLKVTTFSDVFENLTQAFLESNHDPSKSVSEASYKTTEMEPSETLSVSNDRILDTLGPPVPNMNSASINDTSYFCKTCQVAVPNKEFNISQHNNGKNHKKNVNELNENLDNKNEDNENFSSSIITSNVTQGVYYCETCKTNVPNIESCMIEHNNGKKHKNNEKILEENIFKDQKYTNASASNINTSNCNDNSFHCKICDVVLTNNISNISEHMIGDKHLHNARNCFKTVEIKSNVKEVKKIDDKNLNAAAEIFEVHYHLKVINNHNLYCKVCKIFVKSTFSDMNKHIDSYDHEVKYDKLLKFNKVVRWENAKKYTCNYCKVEMTNYNELDHINGKLHSDNVALRTSNKNKDEENPQNLVIAKVPRVRVRGKKKKTGVSENQ